MTRIYNYRFQEVDERDFKFTPQTPRDFIALPTKYSSSSLFNMPAFDQGDLGSCTGNSAADALIIVRKAQNLADLVPSRLFIYYNARDEQDKGEDTGACIKDVFKTLTKQGYCSEKEVPYVISRFAQKPSPAIYESALKNVVKKYEAVPLDVEAIKHAIYERKTINVGVMLYEGFESDKTTKTGKVTIPKKKEKCLGGHAITITGYDDKTKMFEFLNSYGKGWGNNGYGYLPYSYLTNPNLAGDFWTIVLA